VGWYAYGAELSEHEGIITELDLIYRPSKIRWQEVGF
jgi:hypothetical protein